MSSTMYPTQIDVFPYNDPTIDVLLAIEEYVGAESSDNQNSITYRLNHTAAMTNFNGGTP